MFKRLVVSRYRGYVGVFFQLKNLGFFYVISNSKLGDYLFRKMLRSKCDFYVHNVRVNRYYL